MFLRSFLLDRSAQNLFSHNPEITIPYLQRQFYLARQSELIDERSKLKKQLEQYSFEERIQELTKKSLRLLQAELSERCMWQEPRQCFELRDLRGHSSQFNREYPVILSTTYSIKGSLNFDHVYDYPNKYYCEDIGLRNARIGFRQQEMTHIMENIIFNELMVRECAVDIGIVYSNERNAKGKITPVAREIDFIAQSGGKKTYIQSAYAPGSEEKTAAENKPLGLTGDSFPKIIVRHDIRKRWYDDNGVLNIGILDFLLDDTLV